MTVEARMITRRAAPGRPDRPGLGDETGRLLPEGNARRRFRLSDAPA